MDIGKDKEKIGKEGEDIAVKFIKDRGYKIIERNFKSKRWGEIDIIAKINDKLVFVEVKTRTKGGFVSPTDSVDSHKIRTLKRTAQFYKIKNPKTPNSLRLDLISIILHPETQEPLKIEHFEDIEN